MRLYAYAKINWTLDILSRFENGYHEMDMLMQPISLRDEIEIESDNRLSLEIAGDISLPNAADNLIIKAAKALQSATGTACGAKIHLTKNIPTGAGMGGGSADCAAALTGLNRLWRLNLSVGELADIAVELGADVPFCLYGGLCRAQGLGERLALLPLEKTYHLIIIKPEKALSTKAVFSRFDLNERQNRPNTEAALRALQSGDLMLLRASLGNVLTPISQILCPDITRSLAALNRAGAQASFMTGSGNAVVGVFKDIPSRDSAFSLLKDTFNCYTARTQQKSVEMS
jgi:4-diphosphocytidyl-2C-methyl-D-erythritol kinase